MNATPFAPTAKIISAADGSYVTTRFRKFFTAPKASGSVRIAAKNTFVLYLNGKYVLTRNIKSYQFHKFYDEIALDSYLVPGENCLAIESTGPLIAQVESDGQLLCTTGADFRCCGNPAYLRDTLGHSLTLGNEEWYDSRLADADWTAPDFDDSSWVPASEACENWSGYTPYHGQLLTDLPLYGQQIPAQLLCRRMEGTKMNLYAKANGYGADVQIYVTLITCTRDTVLEIQFKHADPRITLDGQAVSLPAAVKKGTHLLCMSMFGGCELQLNIPGGSFSGKLFCGQDCAFARIGFAGASVKSPWHEKADDIRKQVPQLDWFHSRQSPEQITAEYTLQPAEIKGESALADVMFQKYFLPAGGSYLPEMFPEQAPAPCEAENPVTEARHLLQAGGVTEIRNTAAYDSAVVIDLGKEVCGYVNFTVEANQGQILDIQCFEVIDGRGMFLMHVHNGFRYIARDGYQHYQSLSRYGFRYLLLTIRNPGTVRIHDIHVRKTTYPVSLTGTFRSSDALLNQIYTMCIDTTSLCMLDTYVDCPGHEQNFWVGDSDITARNNLMHFGAYEFNQHNIAFVGQSLSQGFIEQFGAIHKHIREGKFLSVGAFDNYPATGLPMWSFLWVQQIWEHYKYSGNLENLQENYGYLHQNLENAQRLINSRGLFDMPGASNLIEWACNDLSPYGEVTANNVFLVNSFRIASRLADILGHTQESQDYAAKAQALRDAINRYCWDEEKQGYVDTVRDAYSYERYCLYYQQQGEKVMSLEDFLACKRVSEQSSTLALLFDCVPEARRDAALRIAARVTDGCYRFAAPADRSVGAPPEGEVRDGIVMVGSPYFLYFSLGTLWKYGLSEIAMKVIRRDWGHMLSKGVNTCWETFEMSDKIFTRSICHAWSSAPSIYLTEEVLGIKPAAAGYREFIVCPHLGDLSWAEGSVATPYGPIHVRARKEQGGKCSFTCQAPPECRLVQGAEPL